MVRDLTQGNILKHVILFSLPFMGANLINALYNLVDMAVIGNVLNSSSMAAASIAGQLTMLFYCLAMGLGNGGQVLISQYVGAKKRNDLPASMGTLITVGIVVGLALTVLGLIFATPLMRMLRPDPSILELSVTYFRICCIGLIPYYIFNMISAVFRAIGDSRTPFLISVVAAGMNIVLDILFMVAFHRGVAGAAVATVISQVCSCVFSIVCLVVRQKKIDVRIALKNFVPEGSKLRMICRLALPLCIGTICINISALFVQSMVNPFGVVASSVTGVGNKLSMLMQSVEHGLTSCTSTFVAQNMGAKQPERARKSVLWGEFVGIVFAAIMISICLIFPRGVFGIFTSEPEVLDMAVTYLRLSVWMYLALAMMGPTQGLVMGVGASRLQLVICLLDGVVARIGLTVLLGTVLGFGLNGYWFGTAIAGFVTFILGWIYFVRKRWMTREIV